MAARAADDAQGLVQYEFIPLKNVREAQELNRMLKMVLNA
jgi:hypothetical protein